MSGVDVLALMDRLSYALQDRAGIVVQVNAARAAVAELIEAAGKASATLSHAYHTQLVGGLAETAHSDYQKLDAALARVTGGAS